MLEKKKKKEIEYILINSFISRNWFYKLNLREFIVMAKRMYIVILFVYNYRDAALIRWTKSSRRSQELFSLV